MKRILIVLSVLLVLAGCGSKEPANPDVVKLSNGLIVTKESMNLTDSYGDLVANDNYAALVLNFSAENTSDKSQTFGNSVINLYINDQLHTAEMLSGGSDALPFFVDVEPAATSSGVVLFGVQPTFSEDDDVKIIFTDVLGEEQGTMILDLSGLEKEITPATEKPKEVVTKAGMQTTEFLGATVSIGNMELFTDEELQVTYPKMSSLKRGYIFVMFDFELTNNTDAPMPADQALLLGIIDNFDELAKNEKVYARNLGDIAIDQETEIAVGETRSGKVLFIIGDDVTSVTVEVKPHRPSNKNPIHFEFEIPAR